MFVIDNTEMSIRIYRPDHIVKKDGNLLGAANTQKGEKRLSVKKASGLYPTVTAAMGVFPFQGPEGFGVRTLPASGFE